MTPIQQAFDSAVQAHQAGDRQRAEQLYRQVLTDDPRHAEAHNNLGTALLQQGQPEEALACYHEAIRLRPDYVDAHNNLGHALNVLGRLDEALACYREALRLRPDYPAAHFNLGNALKAQGKPAEALACFREAVRLRPDYAGAHNNMGNALAQLGKLEEAVACYREAIRLLPSFADPHNNLGNALSELGRWDEALPRLREALRFQPDFAEAHNNIGNVLFEQGRLEEAFASLREALRLQPEFPEAHNDLGNAVFALGKPEEALAYYRQAIRLRPDYPDAHLNLSMALLQRGDFEEGWREYEWRWKGKGWSLPAFSQPLWDSSALEGRTILLHSEQGLGDTLQLVRYAPLVKSRGGRVVFACRRPLIRLLARAGGIDRLVLSEETLPDFDVHVPLLSLPRLLGTTLASVPADVPYLTPEPELFERWGRELVPATGLRVGIAWQGNPEHRKDRLRSVPLRQFEPLARLDGVRLVSLQKGKGVEQIAEVSGRFPVLDLGNRIEDFADTAAALAHLDLVVTVDSAVAHLAGALGVPVWLALPFVADWRWLLDRNDSPWYPTMRLFRQQTRGDWSGVFDRLAAALHDLPARKAARPGMSAIVTGIRGPTPPEEARSTLQQTFNSGLQAHKAGDLPRAEQLYRQVLTADPRHADALRLLGMLVRRQGHPEQAIKYFHQALHLHPDFIEAHCNLGDALFQLNRLDEAAASYREALRLRQSYPEAHNNLGNTLKALGHLEEAVASYRQAIRLCPDFAEAYNNLANTLADQGKREEALACYREAVRLRPDYVEAHNNMGHALAQLGKLEEALACFREAIRLRPIFPDAHNNLGYALSELGRLDEAVSSLREALRLRPDFPEAHNDLGYAVSALGKPKEALASYREAIRLRPDFPDAHLNLSVALLQCGDFEEGWREYEWRWKAKGRSLPDFAQPLWDGSALEGRTILVHSEQGHGDTLQLVRYAPLVKSRGGTVVFGCWQPLTRLLARAAGIDRLVSSEGPLPDFDVHAPLLSLPRLLGTTLASVPTDVPYLTPEPELIERWGRELGPATGLRVGIAWQGNPEHRKDRLRSVPLRLFEPLARLDGVRLVSLQKDKGVEQIAEVADRFSILDLGNRFEDFADTAAVLIHLDLVVTVDSAVAHLAGALGVPVWLALPFVADWRWLLDRQDSPWYPTMRLFRQQTRGDWSGVFDRLAAALRDLPFRKAVTQPGLGTIDTGIQGQTSPEEAMSNLQQTFDSAVQAHKAGDLPRAEQLYRQVLTDDPRHADALHYLGLLVRRQGHAEQAVEYIRQALRLRPDLVEAHYNLGNALFQLGQLEEAAAGYHEAVRLRPSYAEAHNNLGNTLKALGRLPEAAVSYREAAGLWPTLAEAHNNLGSVLLELRRPEEAEASLRQALRLRPDFAAAHTNLGSALLDLRRPEEAEASLGQAIRLDPHSVQAHTILAGMLLAQGRLEEAAASHREVVRLCPDRAEGHNLLGSILFDGGQLEEAQAAFRQAIRLQPDHVEAHRNLGITLLLKGDFPEGWQEYEWRWKGKSYSVPAGAPPLWDGLALEGRTILLQTEQGLGDTLHFVRYAPLVKRCGATVVLACQRPLIRLLAGAPGIDRLVPADEPGMPESDVFAPLLSLPRLLGTTLANIPANVPYLTPEPEELVEHWKRKLGPPSGLRVGIVWQGSPEFRKDRDRSIPLREFEPLARLEGVQLVSLQKGFGTDQIAEVAGLFSVTDLGPDLDRTAAFVDTAAVLANLDLVVTINSAVAHLAGALGVPVWLALPFVPEWRWLLGRDDSPWYPTLRLFRQETRGDWPGVFERLAAALRDLPARKTWAGASTGADGIAAQRGEGKIVTGMRGQTLSEEAASRVQQTFDSAVQAHKTGDLARAEQLYRQVLTDDPRHADALHYLGMLVRRQGHPEQAVEYIRQALDLRPDLVEAHYNLGNALFQLGQLPEAAAGYREAVRLRPSYAEAHNNLGNTLKALDRLPEAAVSYREAVRLWPDLAEAHNNLGSVLLELHRPEEAETSLRQALRLRPDFAAAHNNLGSALLELRRPEEAEASLGQAIRLDPHSAEAHNTLAGTYLAQGRVEEALTAYRQAVRLQPDHAEAHSNLGITLLLKGEFAEGWQEYEWRWQGKGWSVSAGAPPRWDGSALEGRTILLLAEQGLGDTLQLVRYAPLVKSRGGTVVLACQRPLTRLLAHAPGIDRLVPSDEPWPESDVYAPLPSLPRLLGTTLARVPADVPYLTPDPERVERWKRKLGLPSGLRVGIVWQGNPEYRKDRERSVPLRQFEPLARLEGLQLVSLQKGQGVEQIAEVAGRFSILDLGSRFDDFADTAAALVHLDLVVTVDSAVAHLAGALGVPVWLALPFVPDWRWLLDRDDSPWYPTLRLFRQQTRGDWSGVFDRLTAALRDLLIRSGRGGGTSVEVSMGELVDKITILEIKSVRIEGPAKLENVRRELAALRQARTAALPAGEQLDELTAQLRAVNETLWDVEDEIRACEARGDFGPRFIELARSVYRHNDHRSALKRRLNELVGSRLVEEKAYTVYPQQPAVP